MEQQRRPDFADGNRGVYPSVLPSHDCYEDVSENGQITSKAFEEWLTKYRNQLAQLSSGASKRSRGD